ncbi:MAG: lytic transglycosylase F [Woeseiaceae bacterium]|nr:lytic transglycosylase F [Woeseiaceae bacterium]
MLNRLLLLLAAAAISASCGGKEAGDEQSVPAETRTATEEPAAAAVVDDVLASPAIGDLLPQPMEVIWRTWLGDFDGMVERRVVRVVVPYGGYQFYYDSGMPRGAVYELVRRFEEKINKDLERRNVRVYAAVIPLSREQLIPALLEGHADLIAGDLTVTDERRQLLDFSRPLLREVREILVTSASVSGLETLDDLAGRDVYVRRSSSYFEHLSRLADEFPERGLEKPAIRTLDELLEAEDVLELMSAGVFDITVLDEYKAEFWAGVFPELVMRDDIVINEGGTIAWAMRKDSPALAAVVESFLRQYGRGTLVGNDTYNRYLADADRVRCANRSGNIRELDELVGYFRQSGEQFGFDWLMLAAQGLQESGLRQNRQSPAGAVGIMQIKPSTAADRNVGIPDISTAENNIHAGAKYLRFIADRYYADEGIDKLNQWIFSLAAYNAGPARINRFRSEARKQGYDPNVWFDNVEIVAARRIGRETVTYVANIFKYYVSYKLIYERGKVFEERFGDLLAVCAPVD